MSEALKIQPQLPFEDKRKFRPQNFVHTSLFSEVYIFNDLPVQFKSIWDRIDDRGRFDEFYTHLVTLMGSFSPNEAYKWNHSETLKNIIYPMLEILGYGAFESNHHPFLDNHQIAIINSEGNQIDLKPSILICEDEAGKNYIKKSSKDNVKSELRKYLKVPVVTSYYGATFDRKSSRFDLRKDEIGKRGDVYSNLGPNDHIAEYLKNFGTSWGIFTDGSVWRLYRKDAAELDAEKYFEFDFSELYNLFRTSEESASDEHGELFEVAKYLFWFFSYDSLVKGHTVIPFAEDVYQKSQVYVDKIEEDLKERFVHSMTIACNGYLENFKGKNNEENLRLIAKTSESLIFNLIFIRSCESRRVLPVHQDYIHVSLKAIVDKIRHFSYNDAYEASAKLVKQGLKDIFNIVISDDGFDIYNYVQKLHSLVENGDNGFGITGFIETVFYPEEKNFYTKNKIKNSDMIKLVYQLFYSYDKGRNVQVPYNLLTPRQLGSVYESFLEFQPEITLQKLYYIKKMAKKKTYWQWVSAAEVSKNNQSYLPYVEKNGIIFTPNNEERKTTGSYYTPDYIVNYIIKETIGSLCEGATEKEILSIKICDPAMGSGHFLLGALDFLTRKISEKSPGRNLWEVKRDVLESCIFGVDINPSAVKLGKMSLWLATALPGKKLEELSDQLKVGNSLDENSFNWKREFPNIFKKGGFHSFIGNPPYSKIQTLNNIEEGVLQYYKDNYKTGSRGNFDIYVLFYELCLKLINDKGMVGFITPNTYLVSDFGETLRSLFMETKSLRKIVDFKQSQIFEGVSTYTCLTFLNRNKNEEYKYSKIRSTDVNTNDIKFSLPNNEKSEFFDFSKVKLPESSDKWSGAVGDGSELLIRLKKEHKSLSTYTSKIYQGVATSADDVFILDYIKENSEHYFCFSKILNKEIKLEKGICRLFYFGKDISRYSTSKKIRVAIYPYVKDTEGKYVLIDPKILTKNYPLSFKYLVNNRDRLELRESGRYKGLYFFQYSRPQSLEEFDSPKVMMRNFSLKSQITLDVIGGQCFTTNIYGINFKRTDNDFLYFMLSVLNSSLMWFFVKNTSAGIRGGYYQYKTKYVSPFPVVDFDYCLKNYPDEVKRLLDFSKKQIKTGYSERDSLEIDRLVFKLYKLTQAEIEMVLA